MVYSLYYDFEKLPNCPWTTSVHVLTRFTMGIWPWIKTMKVWIWHDLTDLLLKKRFVLSICIVRYLSLQITICYIPILVPFQFLFGHGSMVLHVLDGPSMEVNIYPAGNITTKPPLQNDGSESKTAMPTELFGWRFLHHFSALQGMIGYEVVG